MKKEEIVYGCIKIIEREAKKRRLDIVNEGPGHAFDNTFWSAMLKDYSDIPHIVAKNDEYEIELRSFWCQPEIDIRDGHNLIVLNYSDGKYDENGEYFNSKDFNVHEVRVDGYDYESLLNRAKNLITDVRNYSYEIRSN